MNNRLPNPIHLLGKTKGALLVEYAEWIVSHQREISSRAAIERYVAAMSDDDLAQIAYAAQSAMKTTIEFSQALSAVVRGRNITIKTGGFAS